MLSPFCDRSVVFVSKTCSRRFRRGCTASSKLGELRPHSQLVTLDSLSVSVKEAAQHGCWSVSNRFTHAGSPCCAPDPSARTQSDRLVSLHRARLCPEHTAHRVRTRVAARHCRRGQRAGAHRDSEQCTRAGAGRTGATTSWWSKWGQWDDLARKVSAAFSELMEPWAWLTVTQIAGSATTSRCPRAR